MDPGTAPFSQKDLERISAALAERFASRGQKVIAPELLQPASCKEPITTVKPDPFRAVVMGSAKTAASNAIHSETDGKTG